ncbi:AraC family transcriptional regulator [Bradyrhizobium sp. Leo121]|nr:AraC family transcriptional regulator [Bradyrhizobium sp. Leo121]
MEIVLIESENGRILRKLQRSKFTDRFAQNGIVLSLVHLDLALAVKTGGQDGEQAAKGTRCLRLAAKRRARKCLNAEAAPVVERLDDPVIRRLFDALAVTETGRASHAALCADALRLAILARQFTGRADLRRTGTLSTEGRRSRSVRSLQKWRLKRVVEYVDECLEEKISLQDLATVAGLSRMHFAAQFRAATGMRPHEYLLKRRIERAEVLLKQGDISLVDVAFAVGFQSQAHFTTVFKRFAGDTPFQWRSAHLAVPVEKGPEQSAKGERLENTKFQIATMRSGVRRTTTRRALKTQSTRS